MKVTKKDVAIGLIGGAVGFAVGRNIVGIDVKVRRRGKKNSDQRKEDENEYDYICWFDSYEKANTALETMCDISKEYGSVSTSDWREVCFDNDLGNKPVSKLNQLEISSTFGWYHNELNKGRIHDQRFGGKSGYILVMPKAHDL